MLTKFIAIKNVGRFRNSAGTPNPQLAKHTLITGANGFGKTTLCAVLRSLATGDPAHIVGRKTLGTTDPIEIDLLMTAGSTRFDGASWTVTHPNIAIFDGVFVADNIHSGEMVEITQKRKLYRVIVGEAGVALAEEEAQLALDSRAKTTEITGAGNAIKPYCLPGMKVEEFVGLTADAHIDERIIAQEGVVRSAKDAAAVMARAAIATVPYPSFPEGFRELLGRSLDEIGADAERLVAEHLAKHGMSADDSSWLADGVEHAANSCPFCGQGIEGLPLVEAYRAIFSERYKSLVAEIKAMQERIAGLFGDAAIGRLDTLAEQNSAAVEFWRQHCHLDDAVLAFAAEHREAARRLGIEALALLGRKAMAPLETPVVSDAYSTASMEHGESERQVAHLNTLVTAANELIAAKKREVASTDLKSAENELAARRATRARHLEPAAGLCRTYVGLVRAKEAIDDRKTEVRGQLDAHTDRVVEPYERRINELLNAFNADFSIGKTSHGYPGGIATSSYQLVVNKVAVDLGDSKTGTDQPSFKNTLSAGDRTTLALAFFLAHLERDPEIGGKIVVFDDPFNSQDSFRRRQTVHEIMRIAKKCEQIIVLSHDATFLKQVWEKAPPAERRSLQIADHRSLGSKLSEIDLEKACKGRTAAEIDDLQTFLTTNAGEPLDIIKKMRGVLETYCRTTFPASFADGDWLGDMVGEIRAGGDAHPAAGLYDELDQINDYTKQYHHGERMGDLTPDQIDGTELTGYARRTLRVVNALQA